MAGQIPRYFLDDLLDRVDIVDVIGLRVKLKKSGTNHSACCPFHSEKTPSFTVSQTKQFYHCFGCGANGNAIGFLMEYENMHFVDAVEALAESVGVDVPRDTAVDQGEQENRKQRYQLLENCTAYFVDQLKQHPDAIDYLKRRGLDGETAKKFRIGFAPDAWDSLGKQFPGKNPDLLKTGMLIHNEQKKSHYDRFRNRIMFPIRDRRGRVIAFGGRVLDNGEPKYLNSPETPLFHKGSELYGLYECRKEAQALRQIIVVEGYMDVVALSQFGVEHSVATLGTATNQQHCENIYKIVPEIVFCFDGDRAGRDAAWRALNATLPVLNDGREAYFLFLPDGEDPDSIVSKGGSEAFFDCLEQKKSIVDFMFEHLAGDADLSQIGTRARLAEDAKPLLEKMPPGVYRQLAQQKLESMIGISLGSIAQTHDSFPQNQSASGTRQPRKTASQSRALNPMRRAILLLLQHPELASLIPADTFSINPSLPGATLLSNLASICLSNPQTNTGSLLEHFRDGPDWTAVSKLASTPYFPDGRELEAEQAKDELTHCLNTLGQQSTPREASKVPFSSKTGLLSIVKNTGSGGDENN